MPSWRPDTAQQRLWVGSDRYRSGRRNAGANTKRFAHSCINGYSLRRYDRNSDGNANTVDNCNANTNADCDRNGYGHGSC